MIGSRRLISLLVLLIALSTVALAQQKQHPRKSTPKVKMLLPKAGDQFSVGSKTQIVWQVELPDQLDISRCEQEIYLSLDGGRTLASRITGHLSGSTREFSWVVPDLPTDQAVLLFRFGSNSGDNIFEKSYLKRSTRFRIVRSTAAIEKVEFAPSATPLAHPGNEVEIAWVSNVTALAGFEVRISYDLGGHFIPLANTAATSYRWQVPADFFGNVTFQIVAHKLDGTEISTITPAEPMVRVTE